MIFPFFCFRIIWSSLFLFLPGKNNLQVERPYVSHDGLVVFQSIADNANGRNFDFVDAVVDGIVTERRKLWRGTSTSTIRGVQPRSPCPSLGCWIHFRSLKLNLNVSWAWKVVSDFDLNPLKLYDIKYVKNLNLNGKLNAFKDISNLT